MSVVSPWQRAYSYASVNALKHESNPTVKVQDHTACVQNTVLISLQCLMGSTILEAWWNYGTVDKIFVALSNCLMFKINYSVKQRWYRIFQILEDLHEFCYMSVHNSGLNVRSMWLEYPKLKRVLMICRTVFNSGSQYWQSNACSQPRSGLNHGGDYNS